MTDFQIWESEAFLLGLVVGELSTRQSPLLRPADYDDLLLLRLGPFVPDMSLLREIPLDHLPAEAEELESGGYRSRQYSYIRQTESGYVAVLLDTSRRSLLDLLEDYLNRGLVRSADADVTNQQTARLKGLCERCGFSAEFESGRSFGEFLGLTLSTQREVEIRDSIDGHVSYGSCPLMKLFELRRRPLVDQMIASLVVQRCDPARLALITLKGSWCESFGEYFLPGPGNLPIEEDEIVPSEDYLAERSDSVEDVESEASVGQANDGIWIGPEIVYLEMEGTIQAFWICVGLIYRNLQEYANRERKPQLPRALLLNEPPGLHMLPLALQMAERDLHSESPLQTPAEIVTLLSLCVETLVTSVWPRTTPHQSTGQILRDHRHDPDERLQHFARLAELLQQRYRNDALHHGQSFAARVTSWTEAMYVYSALRVLVDLHDAIKAAKS